MGQKVHPTGIRLGITEQDRSVWFAGSKPEFAANVYRDFKVRQFLEKRLNGASVCRVQIERPGNNLNVVIHAARPGVIIGKKGGDLETLRAEIAELAGLPVQVSIQEIKKPDMESVLVAESVAQQLEKRISFRRAVKRAIQTTMRQGAKGIKVSVAGRLGGAEIARTEWYKEGSIPLHTFRADIDYGTARAQTTYGVIGVKVWIYKGDKLSLLSEKKQADQAKADSV
jgi:small subunit ribosomal protein S3